MSEGSAIDGLYGSGDDAGQDLVLGCPFPKVLWANGQDQLCGVLVALLNCYM